MDVQGKSYGRTPHTICMGEKNKVVRNQISKC